MTNREAYLQELNELAATCVMEWHTVVHGWNGSYYAVYRDDDANEQIEVEDWQPCQNETQALLLVDKVLEGADTEVHRVWAFRLGHDVPYWGANFTRYSVESGSWNTPGRALAITRATIEESGGELPECEGGEW